MTREDEGDADGASLPSQLTYGGGERLLVLHLLVHVEHDGPPVEPHVLRVDHVLQEVDGVLAPVVAGAPAQDASQVVAGAQRHDGAGGGLALRILAYVVEALQDPADGAVAAAHQDLVVLHVPEHVQPAGARR